LAAAWNELWQHDLFPSLTLRRC